MDLHIALRAVEQRQIAARYLKHGPQIGYSEHGYTITGVGVLPAGQRTTLNFTLQGQLRWARRWYFRSTGEPAQKYFKQGSRAWLKFEKHYKYLAVPEFKN